jgi:hypothetical protein
MPVVVAINLQTIRCTAADRLVSRPSRACPSEFDHDGAAKLIPDLDGERK